MLSANCLAIVDIHCIEHHINECIIITYVLQQALVNVYECMIAVQPAPVNVYECMIAVQQAPLNVYECMITVQ